MDSRSRSEARARKRGARRSCIFSSLGRGIPHRLLELERGEECAAPLTPIDCRIWLANKREGKSHAEIARKAYQRLLNDGKGRRGNQKAISLVRRTVRRVEQYLVDPSRHWSRSKREEFARLYQALSFGAVPIYIEKRSRNLDANKVQSRS